MDKILVTGGSGLVGRCFTEDNFYRISSKDGNLTDPKAILGLLEKSNYNGIIHCAARVGGIMGNMNNQGLYFYENTMMNTLLIEEARKRNIQKLILYSSTCVFPDKVEYPLSPEKIQLGPPHESNYGYAYAKRMGIVQTRSYREQYGLNYFCVIPCNIYGPGDNYNIENGHVIPSLIHKIYIAHRDGKDFTAWGSGNPLREFIFSEDVAQLTKLLYADYNEPDPVILSTSEEVRIKDLVLAIADHFKFKGKIVFDSSKPDGQFRKPSDNSVIKKMYPDFKFTSLEEGLEKSINWFIENYEKARK
jgi:GDP-L-fucose synthase